MLLFPALILSMLMLILPSLSVADSIIEKGHYIFQLANCYGCHTDIENDGPALAGGRALETEFGTFYTPNITTDKVNGIGSWTDKQFIYALRHGIAPGGSNYFPAFPYIAYRHMTEADMLALKAYLFTLPVVKQVNKSHQIKWYLSRLLMPIWNMLNDEKPAKSIENPRGDYLINTLGHCNECHTPRNALGLLQMQHRLSGNQLLSAPDISSSQNGIADWSDEELSDLFRDGALPDGDYVSDHMAEVVEFSSSKWNEEDLRAAIQYLKNP